MCIQQNGSNNKCLLKGIKTDLLHLFLVSVNKQYGIERIMSKRCLWERAQSHDDSALGSQYKLSHKSHFVQIGRTNKYNYMTKFKFYPLIGFSGLIGKALSVSGRLPKIQISFEAATSF